MTIYNRLNAVICGRLDYLINHAIGDRLECRHNVRLENLLDDRLGGGFNEEWSNEGLDNWILIADIWNEDILTRSISVGKDRTYSKQKRVKRKDSKINKGILSQTRKRGFLSH